MPYSSNQVGCCMKTIKVHVTDYDGIPINASKLLVWGNSAAWVCLCGELLDRTGNSEFKVVCSKCGENMKSKELKTKGVVLILERLKVSSKYANQKFERAARRLAPCI